MSGKNKYLLLSTQVDCLDPFGEEVGNYHEHMS